MTFDPGQADHEGHASRWVDRDERLLIAPTRLAA